MGPTEREIGMNALEVPWANRGCPGSGIRSGGRGRRLGTGQGRGPIGSPVERIVPLRKGTVHSRPVRATRRR
jgi:hypothetical protein